MWTTGLRFFFVCFLLFAVWTFRLVDCVGRRTDTEEGVTELPATTDCRASVWSAALQREFPLPETFDSLDMNNRSREAINTWVEAPRLCRYAIAVGSICGRYADVERWLPCGVLLERKERILGGSTSALWIAIFRGAKLERLLRRLERS